MKNHFENSPLSLRHQIFIVDGTVVMGQSTKIGILRIYIFSLKRICFFLNKPSQTDTFQ